MEEDFKKIHVKTTSDPVMKKKKSRFPIKFILIPLLALVVLVGIIGVILLPLRGVIAKGRELTPIAKEAAGIKDVVGKILGTSNKISNVYATLKALETISQMKELRKDKENDKNVA